MSILLQKTEIKVIMIYGIKNHLNMKGLIIFENQKKTVGQT